MAQENYDYAAEMFTTCVLGDPGNVAYVQSFLGNLKKKYNNNKRGSALATIQGARHLAGMKKAARQKDWMGVIRAGLEMLKLNPWHVPTLASLADACRELGQQDARLAYLKMAQEARPNDPAVNKMCALALAELKQYDQAIACWHLVERAKPGDEEAAKAIAQLTIEKTIHSGGYSDPSRAGKKVVSETPAARPEEPQPSPATPEAALLAEIRRNPKNFPKYLELTELYIANHRFDAAIQLMQKAVQASDNDPDVLERLMDVELRSLRHRAAELEKKAAGGADPALQKEAEEAQKAVLAKEIELFQKRVERFPNNATFHYELGLRYKQAGNLNEAIAEFQKARHEPRHRGACLVELGECFQQIKQYRLAMGHYAEAIKELADREGELRKLALYRAGRLALGLRDLPAAEEYLTALAGTDFAYKDVPQLLEKLAELQHEKSSSDGDEGSSPN